MESAGQKENNFGILRLLFAILVIVSHSSEIIDGNRSRELMTRIFGTLSFGELAVDGFFLISGYLITKSFVQSQSTSSYLAKRLARIVPGYLVAFWICVLVIAPLAGAVQPLSSGQVIRHQMMLSLFLLPPNVSGVFTGLPYPALNAPMWTIAYEMACYLATVCVGLSGMFNPRRRILWLLCAATLLILNALHAFDGLTTEGHRLPMSLLRFGSLFAVGSVYFLFRDNVKLGALGAATAGLALIAGLFIGSVAETAFAIFGAYLIFWYALKVRVSPLSRIANRADLSYGLYLYAWPIQSLMVWTYKFPISSASSGPLMLTGLSVLATGAVAYASWALIERPCLRLAHRRLRASPAST